MATTVDAVMDAVKTLVESVTPAIVPSASNATATTFKHVESHLPWFSEEKGQEFGDFDRAFAIFAGTQAEGRAYGQMVDRDAEAQITLSVMYQPNLDSSMYNLEKRMARDSEQIESKLLKSPPAGCRTVNLTSRIPNRSPTPNPDKVTVEIEFRYTYRVNF